MPKKDSLVLLRKLDNYTEANKQLEEKHYNAARPIFIELGDYLDVPAGLEACNSALYQGASKLLEQGDVATAFEVFKLLGNYSGSESIVDGIEADYQTATELFQQGQYIEAAEAFAALKNYSNSETQAKESLYQNAAAMANEGQYADAIDTYAALNDYLDSADRVKAVSYDWAGALWKAGNRQEAAELYKNLGEYSDAAQQLTTISAEIADVAMEEKDYTQKGLRVFWDAPEMEPGDFEEQLHWQIEHSPNYIFIGTEAAKRFRTDVKDFVAEEVRLALELYHASPNKDRVAIHVLPKLSDEDKKRAVRNVPHVKDIIVKR